MSEVCDASGANLDPSRKEVSAGVAVSCDEACALCHPRPVCGQARIVLHALNPAGEVVDLAQLAGHFCVSLYMMIDLPRAVYIYLAGSRQADYLS